jgi:hypothetical protein
MRHSIIFDNNFLIPLIPAEYFGCRPKKGFGCIGDMNQIPYASFRFIVRQCASPQVRRPMGIAKNPAALRVPA